MTKLNKADSPVAAESVREERVAAERQGIHTVVDGICNTPAAELEGAPDEPPVNDTLRRK